MSPHVEETMCQTIKQQDEPILKTEYPTKYKPMMVIKQILLHGFSFYALLFGIREMKMLTFIYTILLYIIAALGVMAGVHRLWSHRSYKATWPLKLFLYGAYFLCSHAPILEWVRLHRLHHKYEDTEADPYNSRRGFFFSHMGWFMTCKTPECQIKIREIDVSDILNDQIAMFHRRYFYQISILMFFLPAVIPVLYWEEDFFLSVLATGFLRTVAIEHVVLSINSFNHMYGCKPYNKKIEATNLAPIAFLGLGEGWHNYHHTFPWDYRSAEFGERFDFTGNFIHLCSKIGLAYDLKTTTPTMIAKMKGKSGDGSYDNRYNNIKLME